MSEEQLNTIVGLIGGLEVAVLHLANVIAESGAVDKQALAASFEATANGVPPGVMNRDLLVRPLLHIAAGLRGAAVPDSSEHLRKLLH